MSSFVEIVRTDRGNKRPITVPELQRLALARDDMKVERATADTGAEAYIYWTALSASEPCMALRDGELTTFHPDERIMPWLIDLASSLNGRVRDDEYLSYGLDGSAEVHPDDEELRSEAVARGTKISKRARKQTLFLNLGILSAFGLLAFLVSQCSS